MERIHRTDGYTVSGETVSPVIHWLFTGISTRVASKFEQMPCLTGERVKQLGRFFTPSPVKNSSPYQQAPLIRCSIN